MYYCNLSLVQSQGDKMAASQDRPFIKARLTATAESWQAMEILASWRKLREMSKHLPRAILLYAALLRRDVTVLDEYFPYLLDAVGGSASRNISRPAPKYDAPRIVIREKTEAEDIDDMLDSVDW
jgi:hypothetical protein